MFLLCNCSRAYAHPHFELAKHSLALHFMLFYLSALVPVMYKEASVKARNLKVEVFFMRKTKSGFTEITPALEPKH